MDKLCGICLEQMDMLTYKDERESTSTCFKLMCNHAFHTKCIIECLQKTNKECPCCNQSRDFAQELTREGLIINMVRELRKDDRVKQAISEYKEARQELQETTKQLKTDIIDFFNKRKEELLYDTKHKYFTSTISNVKSKMREVSIEKGPQYRTMFSQSPHRHLRMHHFERFVLNAYSYNYYKLKHKRISVRL